jgi:hypothetical protein
MGIPSESTDRPPSVLQGRRVKVASTGADVIVDAMDGHLTQTDAFAPAIGADPPRVGTPASIVGRS